MASPEEADEQAVEITDQDIESLDEKLIAFSETLPGGERMLLEELIARAVSGEEGEVQGYGKRWRISHRFLGGHTRDTLFGRARSGLKHGVRDLFGTE